MTNTTDTYEVQTQDRRGMYVPVNGASGDDVHAVKLRAQRLAGETGRTTRVVSRAGSVFGYFNHGR